MYAGESPHRSYQLIMIAARFALIIVIMVGAAIVTGFSPIPAANADQFNLKINKLVFTPGDDLILFGDGAPNDIYAVNIYDPVGRAIRIDSIASGESGVFRQTVFKWPQPSTSISFGQYAVEISSSIGAPFTRQVEVTFAEGTVENVTSPVSSHVLSVKLDTPVEVQIKKQFRVSVQVTFDGALVDADATELLGSSHIHAGNATINLSRDFKKIHEGLYYADLTLPTEGTYVIHISAFYKGYLSHDSNVVSATSSSISELNDRLREANKDLAFLQTRLTEATSNLEDTRTSLKQSVDGARESISSDVKSARDAVNDLSQASGQINSIILPVLILISIIIALQISLFARIRASYR